MSALCLPVILAGVVGCQQPLDPGSMSGEAAQRSAEVVHSTARALRANDKAAGAAEGTGDGLAIIGRTFGRIPLNPTANEGSGSGPTTPPQPKRTVVSDWRRLGARLGMERLGRLFAERAQRDATFPNAHPRVQLAAPEPDEATSLADGLDKAADQLDKLIRERLLAPANLEDKNDVEATYRLKPDPTCRDLDTGAIDEDCRDTLTKLEVRIRLTRDGEGSEELGVLVETRAE